MVLPRKWFGRLLFGLFVLSVLGVAFVLGRAFYLSNRTIFDLLRESETLRNAIANLTTESEIGMAKVVNQMEANGTTLTEILFVVSDRDDPDNRLLEKRFTIEGDVVHFDALIVRFDEELVKDGRERALYLWRRIYGERTPPEQGKLIEEPGTQPKRYAEIFKLVPEREGEMFWSEIWALANNPDRLKEAGITAVYGNVLYQKLEPGRVYIFKIKNTGDSYVETMMDL